MTGDVEGVPCFHTHQYMDTRGYSYQIMVQWIILVHVHWSRIFVQHHALTYSDFSAVVRVMTVVGSEGVRVSYHLAPRDRPVSTNIYCIVRVFYMVFFLDIERLCLAWHLCEACHQGAAASYK